MIIKELKKQIEKREKEKRINNKNRFIRKRE
jgi:hypothetical protein